MGGDEKSINHIIMSKIILGLAVAIVLFGAGFLVWRGQEMEVKREETDLARMNLPASSLTGKRCENAFRRPLAVMLSSDPETRPLSGIAEADWIFEMPVTSGGVTRLMAVFQCQEPLEIGSIRSARLDFIPLVQGLNAIYAHWGGEKEALTQLKTGAVNNLDALKYEGTLYYRKTDRPAPHNGFSRFSLLWGEAIKNGWALTKSSVSYLAEKELTKDQLPEEGINPPMLYDQKFKTEWRYQAKDNNYYRWREGREEIDDNSGQVVAVKNVVLMKTAWTPLNQDYIRVKTVGGGKAEIYQNGQLIKGRWEKKSARDKLTFFRETGEELKWTPGPVWVEIIF